MNMLLYIILYACGTAANYLKVIEKWQYLNDITNSWLQLTFFMVTFNFSDNRMLIRSKVGPVN